MNLSRFIWTTPGVVFIMTSSAFAQQAGSLRGVIIDREFGTPVSGASVTIIENGQKVSTNDQGNFVFNGLLPGRYTVKISRSGFVQQIKRDVLVSEGQLTDLDAELAGEFEDMDEVVVQELELGGSDGALLELRLDSPQLLDSVGADMMSKAGAGDAAAALLLVSGATVQDGKYAVVRGLPDRYVSAQLDGVRLPTSDATRRAVQLDQFPSAIIQSVQVSKSFTPDQQGDASGGAVNIELKDIPDESFFQIKAQTGYNSQVKDAGNNFRTYSGANLGNWGKYEGSTIPTDLIGQSWPNPVGTETGSAPNNDYKWSVSGGGKWDLDDGVKVGAFASLFYEREYSYFTGGKDDSWWITPNEGTVPQYSQGSPTQLAFQSSMLDIEQGQESVQWGGLVSGGIESENNKFGATYLYTDLSTSTATLATNTRGKAYFCGPNYDWSAQGIEPLPPYTVDSRSSVANTTLLFASPYQRLETLDYTETTTESMILKGEHKLGFDSVFGVFDAPVLDWTFSNSTATFNEPDKTQYSANWLPPNNDYLPDWPAGLWIPYQPAQNINLGWAQHIQQSIDETSDQLSVNLKFPFQTDSERDGSFKTGVFADNVNRTFLQETYSNRASDGSTSYEGAWDDPWSAHFPDEDHPMYASTYDVDYDGTQSITALYLMADLPIGESWNLVVGARLESTQISTTVYGEKDAVWFPPGALAPVSFVGNPGAADVDFNESRALPSISTKWKMAEGVTLRTAYSQTLARQTFRELTPVLQQEYLGGPIFIGNPDLNMSSLDNYDLRLDYTPYEGWLISTSGFYKSVADTIEYSQFEAPGGFVYTSAVNYPEGTMMGVEFETRVQARNIDERLEGLSAGFNATYIDSKVTLPESEQEAFTAIGFPIESRGMTGAPLYLLNANVTYEWMALGTQASIFYTVTGDTLLTGAGIDTGNFVPDVYALPYGTLNFTVQQKLGEHFKLFFQAKNLLNPEIQTAYRSDYLPNGDIVNTSYTAGIDFALGLSFQMNF